MLPTLWPTRGPCGQSLCKILPSKFCTINRASFNLKVNSSISPLTLSFQNLSHQNHTVGQTNHLKPGESWDAPTKTLTPALITFCRWCHQWAKHTNSVSRCEFHLYDSQESVTEQPWARFCSCFPFFPRDRGLANLKVGLASVTAITQQSEIPVDKATWWHLVKLYDLRNSLIFLIIRQSYDVANSCMNLMILNRYIFF